MTLDRPHDSVAIEFAPQVPSTTTPSGLTQVRLLPMASDGQSETPTKLSRAKRRSSVNDNLQELEEHVVHYYNINSSYIRVFCNYSDIQRSSEKPS